MEILRRKSVRKRVAAAGIALSLGLSACSGTADGEKTMPPPAPSISQTLPQTIEAPLTGVPLSKEEGEKIIHKRPLSIVVENSVAARPQSGLSSADVVYEIIAEGGITRFLAVYQSKEEKIVGPVRSARTNSLYHASEYGSDPLYVHWGAAQVPGPADALSQIRSYGWQGYNEIEGMGSGSFWGDPARLPGVAVEHTKYTSTEKLRKEYEGRGLGEIDKNGSYWDTSFHKYTFKEGSPSEAPNVNSLHLEFWGVPQYTVDWNYSKEQNNYVRSNGGEVAVDRNNGLPLKAENVVLLFEKETRLQDSKNHVLYQATGEGEALVFQDGKSIAATWKKPERTARTMLVNENGEEIAFVQGKTWIEVVPEGSGVSVSK